MTPSDSDQGPGPHESVLFQEVDELLALEAGQVVVDATVGAGGHSAAIAARIGPTGFLVGLDRDPDALGLARRRLAGAACRVELVHSSYAGLEAVLAALDLREVDAVLMDLGVGSWQLDIPGRGMSFRHEGPLDMRFDPTSGETAEEVLRRATEQDLTSWFREYGEERYARRIARSLVEARKGRMLPRTTGELAALVVRAVPPAARRGRIHPATRVFQALRIVVNRELETLELGLEAAERALRPEGRLAVISFHSLEDRRVKRFTRDRMDPISKKPVFASEEEVRDNPRARSARLRVAVKRAASSDPNHLDPGGAP
ncbi:MAG: 16S rRNA (cytosine(1402)-N(4))-methyltransferase RsmH [Planctomycetota bacterium]